MREIVTLQLGQLSNYTATHFWNAQESYFTYGEERSPVDHDIFWRTGIAANGSETFLPRTVIYDLKGSFGSLRKINALYDPEPDLDPTALWSGRKLVEKQTPLEQNAYQQALDTGSVTPKLTTSTVGYWSDFSRTFYHPKSLVQLYDFELNSNIRPFDRFSAGAELFSTLEKDDEIVDRDFRPFVEECDRMQGVQVFTGLDDAWGGFGSEYLENLQDEYPKASILVWGNQTPDDGLAREKRLLKLSNIAQSISRMSSAASMIVPLSLPVRRPGGLAGLEAKSSWHVSALMSAALESATLPLRMNQSLTGQPAISIDETMNILNAGGTQTLARLRFSIGHQLRDSELTQESEEDINLFAIGGEESTQKPPQIFGEITSDRGFGVDSAVEEAETWTPSRPIPGQPVLRRFDYATPYPLLDSFPSIFTTAKNENTVRVSTILSTDTSIKASIRRLREKVTWTLPIDERETLANGLDEIADAYEGDWSNGSDDDDDE